MKKLFCLITLILSSVTASAGVTCPVTFEGDKVAYLDAAESFVIQGSPSCDSAVERAKACSIGVGRIDASILSSATRVCEGAVKAFNDKLKSKLDACANTYSSQGSAESRLDWANCELSATQQAAKKIK